MTHSSNINYFISGKRSSAFEIYMFIYIYRFFVFNSTLPVNVCRILMMPFVKWFKVYAHIIQIWQFLHVFNEISFARRNNRPNSPTDKAMRTWQNVDSLVHIVNSLNSVRFYWEVESPVTLWCVCFSAQHPRL